MIKRFAIVSLFMVCGLLLLAGCKKQAADTATPPTDTTTLPAEVEDTPTEALSGDEIDDLWAASSQAVDSLQVDVTMTNPDGSSQGVMQIITDGDVTKMVATSDQGTATIIYTQDASYMQMEGRDDWIRLPSLDQQPIQPVTFEANKLAEIRAQNADVTYLGEESCEVGRCDVYEGTDDAGKSKVYFNSSDKLLAKVVATQEDGTTATMLYTYDVPVEITIPTNVQEFDIGSFQQ